MLFVMLLHACFGGWSEDGVNSKRSVVPFCVLRAELAMNTIQIMAGKAGKIANGMTVNQDMGHISGCPVPSEGPVYLEGRLVLSLSFQGGRMKDCPIANMGDILERYRLWDDLADAWYDGSLEVARFERADVVIRTDLGPTTLWVGSVDTRARVVLEPDFDDAGLAANREWDLCWKRF